MRAGQLRNRISIQEQTPQREASGAIIPGLGWRTVAKRWAKLEALAGGETQNAQQVQAISTHRIVVRFYEGLGVQHRIRFGDRTFSVNSVLDVEGRKREQEVTATEVPTEEGPTEAA